MDFATLLGLIFGIGIVVSAIIVGGNALAFINLPSFMVVMGGTFGAVMMQFSMGQLLGAFKIAFKAFIFKLDTPQEVIEQAMEMAKKARSNGLLALDDEEYSNAFMHKGIRMLVDGHDPDVVRKTLTADMDLAVERHEVGRGIFSAIGGTAPAMGMIGTLIGLVQMLAHMEDPKTIGPAMAVALLTTLYGAMIANIFALPIADKLAMRSRQERMIKSMIIDTLIAISEGRNPRVIEELLKTYLPVSKRED